MRKRNYICLILIIIITFFTGCSNNSADYPKDTIKRLNVIEYSDKGIMAADEDSQSPYYDIANSDYKITDSNNNELSWNELKTSKVIEVHFSGIILETYPAKLCEITEIILIS